MRPAPCLAWAPLHACVHIRWYLPPLFLPLIPASVDLPARHLGCLAAPTVCFTRKERPERCELFLSLCLFPAPVYVCGLSALSVCYYPCFASCHLHPPVGGSHSASLHGLVLCPQAHCPTTQHCMPVTLICLATTSLSLQLPPPHHRSPLASSLCAVGLCHVFSSPLRLAIPFSCITWAQPPDLT